MATYFFLLWKGYIVGYGLYHETLTLKKIAGILICLGGLVLINI